MSSKQFIQQLINTFSESSGKINLEKLDDYLKQNDDINTKCHIFRKKLQNALSKKTQVSKEQFEKIFTPDLFNLEHFDIVFDAIDTNNSQFISKRQLKVLNKSLNLNFTEDELEIMIDFVAEDGQKISKKELFEFIRSTQ